MAEAFLHRSAIASIQRSQLRALLAAILPANPFYQRKLAGSGLSADLASLAEFIQRAPFTLKQELVDDQQAHPPYGTNLTFSLEQYTRCHQTSGSSGTPIRWLDTPQSWSWMLDNWERVHRAAGTTHRDHIYFAFSFGPFLGFWTAFESALRLGCLCLPGGGLNSVARLRSIIDNQATILCCTPTYAIRLAEVAAEEKIDLSAARIKTLSVAGEPGGSIPATRRRLEELWPGARVFDHHGMTEVGPVSFECPQRPGVLHIIETSYLAEVIDPATGKEVAAGQTGELILTNLGRTGSPLLRYRTGDLVKPSCVPSDIYAPPCACGRHSLALEGGILGRTDDMVVVRGVNVFPSAVEEVVRSFAEIAEYQARISNARALAELSVCIEPQPGCADVRGLVTHLERKLEGAFALRIPVTVAESLPRFEGKAKRWIRE
jgi:phenylacetate-CoA ligase